MMMLAGKNKKGFTLVEAIAATLVLSMSVIVLAGITTRSMNNVKDTVAYEQAWDLVDRQLTMVDFLGVSEYIAQGPTQGVYETDGTDYNWKLVIEEIEQDGTLYDVTVTVNWSSDYKVRSVKAQTRLSSYSFDI